MEESRVPFNQFLKFSMNVYTFCDESVGRRVLFPAFMNLWPSEECETIEIRSSYNSRAYKIFDRTISSRDLAVITSVVLRELIEDRIITEVDLPQPIKKVDLLVTYINIPNYSVYPCYEVLKHPRLADKNR